MSVWRYLGIVATTIATSATLAHAQATPVADLAVEKTAPAESAAGTDVPFDVTVLNNGPDPAINAVVVDSVPAGTTFVSAVQNSGPAFSCTTPAVGSGSGSISCTCPSLGNGTSATFTFVFHIDPGTPAGTFITNVAAAATDTFDSTEENSSGSAVTQTPPPPIADMRVTKVVGASGANPDTDVIYTLDLSNGGPGDATTVRLDDPIPGNMTVVSVTQTAGPALSCSNGSGGTVTCTAASFPAGATASVTIVGHIPAGTGEGTTYVNIATVTSTFDPNVENDTATTLVCVQDDLCVGGACNGGVAVVCAGTDQCHDPGTCNTATGACSASLPKTNGSACSDGNACTQTDTCQAGVCTGASPVVCPAASQCQTQGACDTTTGTCAANPPKTNGAACNDGNACTQTDTCQAGACTGASPVVCPAPNQCQTQGTCDTNTGTCAANPPKTDGTACNDSNACTQTDTCQTGVCNGASPVVCPAPDQCHTQGTCDANTGTCAANPPKTNGAVCNDGSACTQTDSCQAGVCTGASPVACPAPDQCHTQGTCDTNTGICAANPPKTNGAVCNDGNACTQTDSCQAGVCGGTVVSCDDSNSCTTDSCDPVMGCLHVGGCDAGVDAVVDAATEGASGDATPADATGADTARADATATDAVPVDAAPTDAPRLDGAPTDTARMDAAPTDTARADAAPTDTRLDGAVADARADVVDSRASDARPADAVDGRSGVVPSGSGCGCVTGGATQTTAPLVWLLLLGLFAGRRTRPRRL